MLAGVTFRLEPGEAIEVTGRNGAGKSTLLRAIAGLLPLTRGTVRLVMPGTPDEALPLTESVHLVGHADGLKSALTARENLAVGAAVAGRAALAPAVALDRLGLAGIGDLPVAYLSAGQRRRVALARLLAAWRPLWLLDEPATALDAVAQATLKTVVAEHRAAGGLVIAATHAPLGMPNARDLRLEA